MVTIEVICYDNMSTLFSDVSSVFSVQQGSMLWAMVNNHCLFEMTDYIVLVAFLPVCGCVFTLVNYCTSGGRNNRDTPRSNASKYNHVLLLFVINKNARVSNYMLKVQCAFFHVHGCINGREAGWQQDRWACSFCERCECTVFDATGVASLQRLLPHRRAGINNSYCVNLKITHRCLFPRCVCAWNCNLW